MKWLKMMMTQSQNKASFGCCFTAASAQSIFGCLEHKHQNPSQYVHGWQVELKWFPIFHNNPQPLSWTVASAECLGRVQLTEVNIFLWHRVSLLCVMQTHAQLRVPLRYVATRLRPVIHSRSVKLVEFSRVVQRLWLIAAICRTSR